MKNTGAGTVLSKERDSNLELYRVVVMLLIIAHHYVVNSGITEHMYANPDAKRTAVLYLFGAWGKTGINCYVLITGYFMCKSRITWTKFTKLILQIQFYKLVCYGIFWLTGYETFSKEGLRELLLPVTEIGKNFSGSYVVFYLFIPFLNKLLQNLSERMHVLLLLLCLGAYTGLGSIAWMNVTFNYVSWFCVIYICAAYFRMYPKKIFDNTVFWGCAMVISLLLSVISILLRLEFDSTREVYHFISDSNKILAVTNGITSFLFFKNLKCPYKKWINLLGAATFGVLLIHANSDIMLKWLWKDVLNTAGMFYSNWLFVHMLGSVLMIFAVCAAIDYLRSEYLEKTFFRFLESWQNRSRIQHREIK